MSIADAIEQASTKLDAAGNEMVLDLSGVQRIEVNQLAALEKLAGAAEAKGTKLVLGGVQVAVYKVLKLSKLSPRFSYLG